MTYSTFKTAHVLVWTEFFYKYVVSSCQYHRAKKIVFRITIDNNLDVIASKLGSIGYAKVKFMVQFIFQITLSLPQMANNIIFELNGQCILRTGSRHRKKIIRFALSISGDPDWTQPMLSGCLSNQTLSSKVIP